MPKITVLSGDFPTGVGHFTIRNFTLPGDNEHYLCETICASELEFLNHTNREMALLIENDPELERGIIDPPEGQILFLARFKDKRRFIALTDFRTYKKIVNVSHKEAGLVVHLPKSVIAA